jgi:HEAT repeat protein
MELHQIETDLDSPNPQDRLKAIAELRQYESALAVPLLKRRVSDQEFVIRSFVAIGLGVQQTDEAFELLVNFIEQDRDHNVRAEAANALAKYGEPSLSYLIELFQKDSHWLVRQSILAALEGHKYPETLFKLCLIASRGDHTVVQQAAIANLGELAQTSQASSALELLLSKVDAAEASIRAETALALRQFDDPEAETALAKLRNDSDYQVVGATLEGLV